ncbi:DnaD domain protein [Paenibacillus elgii]|uniref:DnaD domain-containing protein n=1 Tax=Paenibacillus elgii TaxID=189691 RepID=UPI000248D3B2|nr:DnaD domain protein [Paenibacillus elgii]
MSLWIPSYQSLRSHPKTKRLVRKLGVGLPEALGYLHMFWWWAMDFAKEGSLSEYHPDDIADAIDWPGDSTELLNALHHAGFVDRDENGRYVIHDWEEYFGRLLKKWANDAERKRNGRKKKKEVEQISEGCPSDNQGMSEGCPADGAGNIDIDIDINKDLNNIIINNSTKEPMVPNTPEEPKSESNLADAYTPRLQEVCRGIYGVNVIPPKIAEFILDQLRAGMSEAIVIELFYEAVESDNNGGKPPLRFLETIAKTWLKEKITSREDAKQRRQRQQRQANAGRGKSNNPDNRGKPKVSFVSGNEQSRRLTPEERERLLQMAKALDSRKDNHEVLT